MNLILLMASLALGQTCSSNVISEHWEHHEDGSSTVDVEVQVHRPLDEVLRIMDPQGWTGCTKLFDATYLVDEDGDRLLDPPEPGTPWEGVLYEDFNVRFLGWDALSIQNYMHFSSSPGEGDIVHRWEYSLGESLATKVAGCSFDEGVDIDEGFITVTQGDEPGAWVVRGVKRLRFSGPALLNGVTGPLMTWVFKGWADELCCAL